ncbi:hypothetical protein [Oscillibacter sp.]|uniref:hypothetical protein n=1 Tax=Oscillibacter sp. TaxID=1945593 RepID=UPI002897B7E0|nr:hypothetical protein [Oscillibacter sp.]
MLDMHLYKKKEAMYDMVIAETTIKIGTETELLWPALKSRQAIPISPITAPKVAVIK